MTEREKTFQPGIDNNSLDEATGKSESMMYNDTKCDIDMVVYRL